MSRERADLVSIFWFRTVRAIDQAPYGNRTAMMWVNVAGQSRTKSPEKQGKIKGLRMPPVAGGAWSHHFTVKTRVRVPLGVPAPEKIGKMSPRGLQAGFGLGGSICHGER